METQLNSWDALGSHGMTEMRFGFEVTLYIYNS